MQGVGTGVSNGHFLSPLSNLLSEEVKVMSRVPPAKSRALTEEAVSAICEIIADQEPWRWRTKYVRPAERKIHAWLTTT